MRIIGITGGVGAGKSTVLALLKELTSCVIIMADDVAKTTTMPGGPAYEGVVKVLGEAVLDADGSINRGRMANIIFNDEAKKLAVEAIIHPVTKRLIKTMIKDAADKGIYEYAFVEAALLIEDNYDEICEEFWYVYVPEKERIARLIESRNYSEEKCRDIMANQLSDEQFREHCAFVIDNSKATEYTKSQLLGKLCK